MYTTPMGSEIEKRKYTRFSFNQPIQFEVNIPINLRSNDGGKGTGQILDISNGGISLLTGKELGKFQVIKINFPIPNVNVNISTLAEVRWIAKKEKEFLTGMRFLLNA